MPIEILMPALSPTMTEGNLAKWLKKEGDAIEPGMVIAEIETDKATMEVESIDAGIMGKILVAEGTQGVPVNQLIAVLLEEGESADNLATISTAKAPSTQSEVKQIVEEKLAEVQATVTHSTSGHQITDSRIKASPLAKRVAALEGISLDHIQGTGPHGRIIKDDVLDAKKKSPSKAAPIMASGQTQTIPHSMMRKVIAKRLTESKQQVPHFYLTIDCELDNLLRVRQEMNQAAHEGTYKLSVNDFIIKASAMALRATPEANASWTEEAILQYGDIDISVAVAIEGGLITPIIRQADCKSISTISNEMKDLAARAKANKLRPEEFQGGGFSISNLGMFGIKQFNAIINPPQSCILAVGASEERAIVKQGSIQVANIVEVTLSVDHRVVDGAVAARFLSAFKRFIEQPVTMLV